jgi:hypothetical protein
VNTIQRDKRQSVFVALSLHRRYSPVDSDQARQRAEKRFKKEERAQDSRAAVTEYEAEARATREKTARLKALRLAKEAEIVIAL